MSEIRSCSVDGCGRTSEYYRIIKSRKFGKTLCVKCWCIYNKFGIRKCSICGSNINVSQHTKYGDLLCGRHSTQLNKYNKILERTRSDLNDIIIKDDYVEIIIYNNYHNEIARTQIDVKDLIKIKKYKWHICNGYATTNHAQKERRKSKLHQLLIKTPKGQCVDHIDRNKLNNRRENFRVVTLQQNTTNTSISTNNTSGAVGVDFIKTTKKWRTRIKINYKEIHLGIFNTIEEAIEVRKKAELKHWGEVIDR